MNISGWRQLRFTLGNMLSDSIHNTTAKNMSKFAKVGGVLLPSHSPNPAASVQFFMSLKPVKIRLVSHRQYTNVPTSYN